MKHKAVLLFVFFFLITNASFAQEPKVLNYDKENKTIKLEIDGKEYTLDVPTENPVEAIHELPLQGNIQKKEYAKGPPTTNIGPRLFTTHTDNLLPRGGFAFDFTHRFSSPITSGNAGDLWGLDNFAYTGLGLNYGITDFLEAHVYRTSILDAIEGGLKFRLLRESKEFGKGSPFSLVLHSGIQTDNIQNSVDPYIQTIFSKVIIPKWFKIYASPTIAWHTPTIGLPTSKSAIFFPFNDPKGRSFQKYGETFAIPVGAALQVVPNKLSLFGEYVPIANGFKEGINGWSFGLQILSKLETHVWTLGISNMPYSTIGNSIVGAPNNNWYLGFNISARIK